MWTRASTSYGRVLRGSGAARTLWATASTRNASAMQVQQRPRRGMASAVSVAPIAPPPATGKRTRKAVSPKIKEEVRESEATTRTSTVTLRRSERVWIKSEMAIKQEIVKVEPKEEEERAVQEEGDVEEDTKESKLKKRKKVVVKRGKDGKPDNWEEVLRLIKEMRSEHVADVDVVGMEAMFEVGVSPDHIRRFHILISAMLSSQTKDPVNAAAMKRLIARGLTVKDMLDIDENELALLIRPVGFYNNKARYIKQVAQILTDKAAEAGSETVDIPDTFADLVALPGVGPKMAHLVMSCAWDNTVGICVDTHVHRISNRLGWVTTWNKKNPKSQDPEKTRKELEDWLPREHWNPINVTLVGFGQTICHPRGPNCAECKVSHLCPSAFSSII